MAALLRQALAVLLVLAGLLLTTPLCAAPAFAGPVDWHEVAQRPEGRQWWDAGSLRITRDGNVSVLSRFQPAADPDQPDARPPAGQLYVMEIDCGQRLFRDVSVNGLPRFGSSWQISSIDPLIDDVVDAACAAGAPLLPG
jgi:hypothetical protein